MNKKNKNENSEIKTTSNSTEIKTNNDESNVNFSIKDEFIVYLKEIQKSVDNLK
jgi:hypothetical protein